MHNNPMWIVDLLIVIFYLVIFAGVISLVITEKMGFVWPAPVTPWVFNRAKKMLLAHTDVTKPYKIVELGSGWGGPLKKLARIYKNAEIVGYEISPFPYYVSKIRTMFNKRIKVYKRNFFHDDLSGYDITYCYLLPRDLEKLVPIFKTMKQGSLIVTCSFKAEGLDVLAEDDQFFIVHIPVYLHVVR